jgi:uncharacterized protein (DUF2384 family)
MDQFEAYARELLLLMGHPEEHATIWLSTPCPDFDNRSPLALIRAGDGDLVIDLLVDVIHGQPS